MDANSLTVIISSKSNIMVNDQKAANSNRIKKPRTGNQYSHYNWCIITLFIGASSILLRSRTIEYHLRRGKGQAAGWPVDRKQFSPTSLGFFFVLASLLIILDSNSPGNWIEHFVAVTTSCSLMQSIWDQLLFLFYLPSSLRFYPMPRSGGKTY